MKCWSCGAENDLHVVQTCASCGAPLVRSAGVFSKPALLSVVLLGLLLQAVCVFSRLRVR